MKTTTPTTKTQSTQTTTSQPSPAPECQRPQRRRRTKRVRPAAICNHKAATRHCNRTRTIHLLRSPLQIAIERMRNHSRVIAMEFEFVDVHAFRCELCDEMRREEDRREPGSEICIHCMREAGFEE